MNTVESMKPTTEPQFDMDQFCDDLNDEAGISYLASIILESYFYEGSMHLVKLRVSTGYPFTDEIQENVVNLIELRYGKRVVMDCNLELV